MTFEQHRTEGTAEYVYPPYRFLNQARLRFGEPVWESGESGVNNAKPS